MDEEILAAVAAEQPAMVELLGELVAEPTLLGREASGQAVMRRAFARLGLEPFDVPLDAAALERHPGGAPFSWELDGKANVLADWGGGDGRSLILNGHIDVVSPEPSGLWTGDPFAPRVEGDWMYGRGAGDMKAGLAAMVGAVAGLQRLGARPRGRVQLQSVVEEECTGHGALGVRAGRPHGRRGDPDRADERGDLERPGRRAVVPGPRAGRRRRMPATRPTAPTRSRPRTR